MQSKESPDTLYRHYFRDTLVEDAKALWNLYPAQAA